jgi:hypothetical protein
MAIWNILQTFGIFYENSEQFVFIWYIFYGFGLMCQEKSGNPGLEHANGVCEFFRQVHLKKATFVGLKNTML